MISTERGQQLHDRACRGQPLTQGERTELDAWYAEMDAEEAHLLQNNSADPPGGEALRVRLRAEQARLHAIAVRVLEIERGNEELRRRNEELMRELKEKGALVA